MPANPATVLVTDDDDYVRRGVSRLLRHHGHHVVCATSGADALEIVATAPPAVILLDVMMPGFDGMQTARRLRQQHGHACPPIVIMSASHLSEIQRASVGAAGFLRKPFTSDALLTLVERLVANGPTKLSSSAPPDAAHAS